MIEYIRMRICMKSIFITRECLRTHEHSNYVYLLTCKFLVYSLFLCYIFFKNVYYGTSLSKVFWSDKNFPPTPYYYIIINEAVIDASILLLGRHRQFDSRCIPYRRSIRNYSLSKFNAVMTLCRKNPVTKSPSSCDRHALDDFWIA